MELENEVIDGNSFLSSTEIRDYLLETAKWGKFLAILGYIGMGIMLLAGIGFTTFMVSFGEQRYLGLIYIALALIYYFPVSYLYKFSTRIKDGFRNSNDDALITEGFSNLKSLFKFMGIMAIVMLSIYVLVLVGVVVMAVVNH